MGGSRTVDVCMSWSLNAIAEQLQWRSDASRRPTGSNIGHGTAHAIYDFELKARAWGNPVNPLFWATFKINIKKCIGPRRGTEGPKRTLAASRHW